MLRIVARRRRRVSAATSPGGLSGHLGVLRVTFGHGGERSGGRPEAPRSVQVLEIAIDALDIASIRPFWKAVMGYADEAPHRLQGALAAGGTVVSDSRAPAFWVLADAEGNEACITTWQARD